MIDVCPNGCDLQGEPIPEEYIKQGYYAEGSTHYSRMIGVEIRGMYDGVLFWACPDCGTAWHRWQDEYMREKAQPHIDAWIARNDDAI